MTEKDSFIMPRNLLGSESLQIEREICDPIYKYIYLTKMENDIVDSIEFQRLDRLFQTPTTHFVFPNATHTRKCHSLGVMYLANLSLQRLFYRQSSEMRKEIQPLFFNQFVLGDVEELDSLDNYELWDGKSFLEKLETLRIAALCHDIGHGPFSHIFEDVCNSLHEEGKCEKFEHEYMSAKILEERLNDKIKEPIKVDDIVDILLGRKEKLKFLTSIIDGPYDVDKLDYVNRDAYHTGAYEYGALDYIRIIDGFRVKDGKLLLSSEALESVMNSFTATQYMYTCVYYHKTVRIFDFMLFEAMHTIPDYMNELVCDLDKFIKTDDHNFILNVKERLDKSDDDNDYHSAYKILRDLFDRKKRYKNIFKYIVTLDVSSYKEDRLEALRLRLEKEYNDLKTKVDYTAKVKPIRVDSKKFFSWMEEDSIWDESSHKAKNLYDVSIAYFETLKKLQILFYIYIDGQIASEPKSIARIEELRRDAEEQLIRIQMV